MSDDEFVKLNTIKSNNVNLGFDENSIDIYQIQGIENTSNGLIMKVGLMKNVSDVLIKEFTLFAKFTCRIISKLYDLKTLENFNDTETIPMIIIYIYNNVNMKNIATLCYNFNTSVHKQNKNNIINYISNELIIKHLIGYYSITLHFTDNDSINNKYVNLLNESIFPRKEQILINLTKYLLDDQVQSILNELI